MLFSPLTELLHPCPGQQQQLHGIIPGRHFKAAKSRRVHRPTFLSAIIKMPARLQRAVEPFLSSTPQPHLFFPLNRKGLMTSFLEGKILDKSSLNMDVYIRVCARPPMLGSRGQCLWPLGWPEYQPRVAESRQSSLAVSHQQWMFLPRGEAACCRLGFMEKAK